MTTLLLILISESGFSTSLLLTRSKSGFNQIDVYDWYDYGSDIYIIFENRAKDTVTITGVLVKGKSVIFNGGLNITLGEGERDSAYRVISNLSPYLTSDDSSLFELTVQYETATNPGIQLTSSGKLRIGPMENAINWIWGPLFLTLLYVVYRLKDTRYIKPRFAKIVTAAFFSAVSFLLIFSKCVVQIHVPFQLYCDVLGLVLLPLGILLGSVPLFNILLIMSRPIMLVPLFVYFYFLLSVLLFVYTKIKFVYEKTKTRAATP